MSFFISLRSVKLIQTRVWRSVFPGAVIALGVIIIRNITHMTTCVKPDY